MCQARVSMVKMCHARVPGKKNCNPYVGPISEIYFYIYFSMIFLK
jgi:hypothetical protein